MNSRWSDSLGRLSIPLVQAELDLDSVDIDELDSTIEAVGALARGFHSIASQRPRPLRRDAYVASAMAYDILESLLRWQGGLRTMASDALLHRDRAWALADDLQSHLQMARLEPSLSDLLATWCQDVPECRSLRAVAALLKSRPFVAHVAVFEVLDQEDEMREYRARMLRDFGSVPVRFADAESTPPPLPMTIRVRVLIGGTPAVARQAVAANVLHEITVGLSIAEWRGGDTGLEFDFISTLPVDSWDGPRFSFMPWPEGESTREGRLLFKAAIMPDSKPIILQARIRHRASGDWPEPTLVGDTELHVVPTSPESYPQLSTSMTSITQRENYQSTSSGLHSKGASALLSEDEMDRLLDASVVVGLADSQKRLLLMQNLPPHISSGLPTQAGPRDQLLSDLQCLNRASSPFGTGDLALVSWLRMAKRLANNRPEGIYFDKLLIQLANARK